MREGRRGEVPGRRGVSPVVSYPSPQMAVDTLDELDWCLRKLESVDSAKSMGAMARDKFQRILSRELLQMSEKSKSGSHVAEWVHTITNWGESLENNFFECQIMFVSTDAPMRVQR